MENEFMRRGYLLPDGCKDLIDVLGLKTPHESLPGFSSLPLLPSVLGKSPVPVKFLGEIVVPERMTVREVAVVLKQKPFVIIADLMKLGTFAAIDQQIPFSLIVQLAQNYGYIARKAI